MTVRITIPLIHHQERHGHGQRHHQHQGRTGCPGLFAGNAAVESCAFAAQPSQLQTIRFQLEAQLRSDMERIGQVFPGIDATQDLGDATMRCLHASLDRIAGQFENPAPEKYNA